MCQFTSSMCDHCLLNHPYERIGSHYLYNPKFGGNTFLGVFTSLRHATDTLYRKGIPSGRAVRSLNASPPLGTHNENVFQRSAVCRRRSHKEIQNE